MLEHIQVSTSINLLFDVKSTFTLSGDGWPENSDKSLPGSRPLKPPISPSWLLLVWHHDMKPWFLGWKITNPMSATEGLTIGQSSPWAGLTALSSCAPEPRRSNNNGDHYRQDRWYYQGCSKLIKSMACVLNITWHHFFLLCSTRLLKPVYCYGYASVST